MIDIKKHMSRSRYEHVIRVMDLSVRLAEKYCPDRIDEMRTIAYYHDIAKEYSDIINEDYISNILEVKAPLRHGLVGAELIKRELGIDNEDILNAIRFHTTPSENPTILEKIIYVADKNEEGRKFSEHAVVRKLAFKNLDDSFALSIYNTCETLRNKGLGHEISNSMKKWEKRGKKLSNEMYSRSDARRD